MAGLAKEEQTLGDLAVWLLRVVKRETVEGKGAIRGFLCVWVCGCVGVGGGGWVGVVKPFLSFVLYTL